MKAILILFLTIGLSFGADLLIFWHHPLDDEDKTNWTQAQWDEYNILIYKRGDIFAVYPDGTLNVPNPSDRFRVVNVNGLSLATAQKYLIREEVRASVGSEIEDVMTRRRAYHIDTSSLPQNILTQIENDGIVTVNWNALRSRVKYKLTGEDETQVPG